jgi:23S rRNA (uridine2552-2'-O)-methyltransferase
MAKSNKEWLRRHVTDPFVRQAKAQGYRSRAAFKLLEINDREKLLRAGMVVVDLGAAPGGWSQVAAEAVKPGGKVIAVDLLQIAPISGVTILKGDFRDPGVVSALQGAQADVVLSDLSPNMSGIPNVDQARAAEMTQAAIDFCLAHLRPDGAFVVKLFHGVAFDDVLARLKQAFKKVSVRKPAASRGESAETYVLARLLRGV